MLKKLAVALIVLVAAVLIVAATRPGTFRVERSAMIKASPEEIFPYLNDFHKGLAWSPYEKRDPAMKRTYSGAPKGKGSVYEFEGNRQVGTGRLEIIDSVAPSRVVITLDMRKPVEGHDIIEYRLEPKGDGTNFTWAMHGPVAYPAKVLSIFVSMDKMIGRDFESGIASLKALAEKK